MDFSTILPRLMAGRRIYRLGWEGNEKEAFVSIRMVSREAAGRIATISDKSDEDVPMAVNVIEIEGLVKGPNGEKYYMGHDTEQAIPLSDIMAGDWEEVYEDL